MNINECYVGQKVYFGRNNGEKTLGEVVKVNRKKVKIKQLESRGTQRSYPVGTVWTVPPTLCTPANGSKPTQTTTVTPPPRKRQPPKTVSGEAVAKQIGLPRCVVNEAFVCGGTRYLVTGYRPSRYKYPVSATGPRGGRYKFTVQSVINGLVRKAAKVPRTERDIMLEINGIYGALSPENLHCDGEISRSAAARKERALKARLRECEKELGYTVSEHHAWQWWEKNFSHRTA